MEDGKVEIMTKRARRSLPESHYQELVRKYLARKYRCIPVRELSFGGLKLDVVGFSLNTKEFFIVECKRTSRPVGIGKTFGQILAYKVMIYDTGETFLTAFERAIAKAGLTPKSFWMYPTGFVRAGKIPVRFYVALKDSACANPEMLRLIKEDLRGVGIIRVTRNNRCKDYIRVSDAKDFDLCRAACVEVPIALPPRSELGGLLDHKGSNQIVYNLAVKLDAKILKMRRHIKSVRRGRRELYYRVTQNFVGISLRKKHLHVSFKESSGWRASNVSSETQLRRLIPRIKRALEHTLDK